MSQQQAHKLLRSYDGLVFYPVHNQTAVSSNWVSASMRMLWLTQASGPAFSITRLFISGRCRGKNK